MPDDTAPAIVITDRPVDASVLRALTDAWFGDMVKAKMRAIVGEPVGRGGPL